MDPSSEPVQRVPVARRDRRPGLAVVAAAVLLVAAVVKPWPGQPAATRPAPVDPARAGPDLATPNDQRSGTAAIVGQPPPARPADLCESPDGWRIVSVDKEPFGMVRSWTAALATQRASQPGDTAIPISEVLSSDVSVLGFCSPAAPPGAASPGWVGTLWLSADLSTASAWRAVTRLEVGPGFVGVLADPGGSRPGPGSSRAPSAWPAGRYVLQARLVGATTDVWLGLDIARTR